MIFNGARFATEKAVSRPALPMFDSFVGLRGADK